MRRVLRILLNTLTLGSLVLVMIIAVAWTSDAGFRLVDEVEPVRGWETGIWAGTRMIRVHVLGPTVAASPPWTHRSGYGVSYLSAEAQNAAGVPVGHLYSISVHHGWITAACLILPAMWLVRHARERYATRPDHACPTCGYDLRATPSRCPECGTQPAM